MKLFVLSVCLAAFFATTSSKGFGQSVDSNDKLRVCVVEGRGTYKKTSKYCPILEKSSNVECVIGLDRLDCLRRIQKGSAHFGVFSSEDLVAARWAGVEILITNELRFHNEPFEYEIVAVVDNEANINSAQDLRGSKLCHPGYGLASQWTEILANYFESTLVPKICDADISLAEARIKATASFFGSSCKAGPWVPDRIQDQILKKRYPSLCDLCYNPELCGMGDKHWGRRGPLYCLTGGYGEVAWVRLDDVKSHFGFSGLVAETDPSGYSFLCPDGHLQPLTTQKPCVWVAKPWPAIAAKRDHAEQIQLMLEKLSHDEEQSWQNSLLTLLETYHVNVTSLYTSIPIDDYLDQAVGFQSAYSFPSCNPPRSIVFCTTSLIQHYKCSWLQEASSVYGIEPNIQCIRTESVETCMDDTERNVAEVVMVDQDDRIRAERDYHLKPLLYEFSTDIHDRYVVLAAVKANADIYNFNDLRGKRACFPSFEGAAYMSVIETLWNSTLLEKPFTHKSNMKSFFAASSCTWDPMNNENCPTKYVGDEGALRCLAEGNGDVAFLSSEVFKSFSEGKLNDTWVKQIKDKKYKLLCPFGRDTKNEELCYMHWTPRGHIMVNNKTELIRKNEIYNSLRDMDKLFGKHYKSHTIPFTMFGPFDRKENVMFRDKTDGLRNLGEMQRDRSLRLMEQTYSVYSEQVLPSSSGITYENRWIWTIITTTLTIVYCIHLILLS